MPAGTVSEPDVRERGSVATSSHPLRVEARLRCLAPPGEVVIVEHKEPPPRAGGHPDPGSVTAAGHPGRTPLHVDKDEDQIPRAGKEA